MQKRKKMTREYLVKGPLKPALISSYISRFADSQETGGHSMFVGQVRADLVDGKKVIGIDYSVYDNMVEAEAERIISVTKEAFSDIQNIEIVHSTGMVRAGEISLFVLATAGHRDQAFRACRHVVEMIKISYPVWGKEILEDESHQWKENH